MGKKMKKGHNGGELFSGVFSAMKEGEKREE